MESHQTGGERAWEFQVQRRGEGAEDVLGRGEEAEWQKGGGRRGESSLRGEGTEAAG